MKEVQGYGQYCPLAMSSEFLCTRWTMLVLRELLFGSTSFNDISRGVPRMSRTLLSSRLKELILIGVLTLDDKKKGYAHYQLTDAGKALGPVVMAMANWGQEWLQIEPSLQEIDVDLLMWDIRRNAKPLEQLPKPFTVEFFLTDVPENKSQHWLIFEKDEVDLCHINQNFSIDVRIEVSVKKLTKIWMGWEDFASAIKQKDLLLIGNIKYTKIALEWLGQSSVARIEKQPANKRI